MIGRLAARFEDLNGAFRFGSDAGELWSLVPASALERDDLDGEYVRREASLPRLPRDRLGLRRSRQVAESTWWQLRMATGRA